jgi:hypothetical protein
MVRLAFLTALLALVSPVSGIAVAQDWPTRPVRLLVPYPPGGSTDVAARLLADYLSRSIGQQVFVENRSGAGGVVGMEAAVRSAPDGYTVLVAPDNVSSAAHLFKLTFDPLRDLVPILQISRQPVGPRGAPLAWGCVRRRVPRDREEGASAELCNVWCWNPAAHGGSVVREACRDRARARPLQRRRASDHRPRRGTREGRVARLLAIDPLLQGRHASASCAVDGGALSEPAGGAHIPGGRHSGIGTRPMAGSFRPGWNPGLHRG